MCLGQLTPSVRAARKSMKKAKWEQAFAKLNKALIKDSINAGAQYTYSQFYFSQKNPFYNIDSAYRYVTLALGDYEQSSKRERERIEKAKIDSTVIISLRARIDSAAFERAKQVNTEGAYVHFLQAFPFAVQAEEAIILRDEAAYMDATKVNTYESFLTFLEKYPKAARATEARDRYERLLYESSTKERTLASYQQFLAQHPATPYRREVEKHIFEISTASGETSVFISYLKDYPKSPFASNARNILFHLLAERDDPLISNTLLNDSLTRIISLNERYLVPILRGEKFGFINSIGQEVIASELLEIKEEYKCGNVVSDILITGDKLISRDGSLIYRDSINEVEDLGAGFLKISSKACVKVIHKSGFVFKDCIDDVKLIAGKFIALQKNNQWSLNTLTGRSLTPYEYEDISEVNNILLFKKSGGYEISIADEIARAANQQQIKLLGPYLEVKPWPGDRILVKNDSTEGVLANTLTHIAQEKNHTLKSTFFGMVAESDSTFKLYLHNGELFDSVTNIIVNDPWVAVQKDTAWQLLDIETCSYYPKRYDSISYAGPFVFSSAMDSTTVHFSKQKKQTFIQPLNTSFIPGKDSSAFLMIISERKKSIYNQEGVKLFTVEYDKIQYAGQDMFIIWKKNKKGLMNSEGKIVLDVDYDAIGSVTDNYVTLLRNQKFGIYHIGLKKLIKPQYDKNLTVYNHTVITAYQKGLYGFINWDNQTKGDFEFHEVKYWSDTTAMVKRGFEWFTYNVIERKATSDDFRQINYIVDTPAEKIAIVREDEGSGVLSSTRGFVIPPTFGSVKNLGSAEEPLYFTEKHVEEASIFIVIYYDKNGIMLLRQIYEEDDYEKIVCPQK